jgi:hypothetical protein
MSTDRDFDRVARAWLDLSPTEAPDRAIAAALDAIDATPQVRRPLRWPFWRPSPMTRLPLLVALAGVVIVLAGLLLVGGGGPTPTTEPTATPIPSTPTPSPVAVDPALTDDILGGWAGPPRGTLIEGGHPVSFLVFGPPQPPSGVNVWLDPIGQMSTLLSVAERSAADEITIRSSEVSGGCAIGDVGRYRYSSSADSQWLSLEAIEEDCNARADIVPGTWQRSLAHHSAGGPGVAALFEPRFTMTLPPAAYLGRGAGQVDSMVTETSTSTFKVWRDLDGFVDPCDIEAGRLDLEGMDGVLGFLEADARFTVIDREESTIDGRPAVAVRLRIGLDIDAPCWSLDGDQDDPTGVLTYVPHAWAGGFWNNSIGGEEWLVVTEVDGVSLTFESLIFGNGLAIDRDTLDTIQFVNALPTPPPG